MTEETLAQGESPFVPRDIHFGAFAPMAAKCGETEPEEHRNHRSRGSHGHELVSEITSVQRVDTDACKSTLLTENPSKPENPGKEKHKTEKTPLKQ